MRGLSETEGECSHDELQLQLRAALELLRVHGAPPKLPWSVPMPAAPPPALFCGRLTGSVALVPARGRVFVGAAVGCCVVAHCHNARYRGSCVV